MTKIESKKKLMHAVYCIDSCHRDNCYYSQWRVIHFDSRISKRKKKWLLDEFSCSLSHHRFYDLPDEKIPIKKKKNDSTFLWSHLMKFNTREVIEKTERSKSQSLSSRYSSKSKTNSIDTILFEIHSKTPIKFSLLLILFLKSKL